MKNSNSQPMGAISGKAFVASETLLERHGLIYVAPEIREDLRKYSSSAQPTPATITGVVSGLGGHPSNSPATRTPARGELFADFADQTNVVRAKGISPLTVLMLGSLVILGLVIAYSFAMAF